jgi:hypothetical protein
MFANKNDFETRLKNQSEAIQQYQQENELLIAGFNAAAKARDEYKREFQIAQCALSDAQHERDTARGSLRTVTADRDRLLGELQTERSRNALHVCTPPTIKTLASETHAQAFDDITELRASAKRCKETHAALVKIYGEGSNSEWSKAIDDHQSAMLALQVLREKLGT